MISIISNSRQDGVSWYNRLENRFEQVDEVVSDIALSNLSPSQMKEVLRHLSPRLVKLSDGTNKLYLRMGLPGGMMEANQLDLVRALCITDEKVADEVVADSIIKAVPDGSYSSISVRRMNYHFPGEDAAKPSRKITVNPTNWQWFVNVIKVIFAKHSSVNENRAVKAILGSKNDDDAKQLIAAFKKNYSFEIMVSLDGLNFYFEPFRDWTTPRVENACIIL